MSIIDSEKMVFHEEIECFNMKQAKKALKKIEKDTKNVDYGFFNLKISVEYNDRDSLI